MSFQQGLSGLNASSKSLEVIGNNIANSQTYGEKSSRAEFADVYANALNGSGTNQVGIGVTLQKVAQQFTQGSITTTDNPMDMALNGGGFFQVKGADGSINYTRNGQFKLNDTGYIVNNSNQELIGYPADGTGKIQPGAAVALQLPTAGIKPAPTTQITMEMNLDSRVKATAPAAPAAAINFNDATTYNNATSQTVYDAKGQDIAVTYYYQKSADDTWNVFATANGKTVAGTDANPSPIGTISFPSNGGAPSAPAGGLINLDIPASTNAAGASTLAISNIQLDVSGAREYGSSFAVTDLHQDGYAPGDLNSIAIGKDGIITARYSNGQSKSAGQIEIANFRNMQGLQPVGGNVWQQTAASGAPILGTPGVGNLGTLQSGALEESNVDMTAELVNMITAQRVYQANAQTIKTQDQVLQTLVNLR